MALPIVAGVVEISLVVATVANMNGAATANVSFVVAVIGLLGVAVGVGQSADLVEYSKHIRNPPAAVGDVVHRRSDPVPSSERPGLFRKAKPQHRRLYYVVDLSLEGAKVLGIDTASIYAGEAFARKKGTKVDINEIEQVDAPERFSGCATKCSGVNWYCDNNSREHRYAG
jgi:hypothetical protein